MGGNRNWIKRNGRKKQKCLIGGMRPCQKTRKSKKQKHKAEEGNLAKVMVFTAFHDEGKDGGKKGGQKSVQRETSPNVVRQGEKPKRSHKGRGRRCSALANARRMTGDKKPGDRQEGWGGCEEEEEAQ